MLMFFPNVLYPILHSLLSLLSFIFWADPASCIKHAFTNSFMFRGICDQEVIDLIKDLNVKSSIGGPVKCINLASNNISEA